jgi:hypothetical protein
MLLVVAATISSAPLLPAETGAPAVQIVYESDTRGYFLPCG